MANLDIVTLCPPVNGEQVCNETTVTFLGTGFGTE
jgi:hypothetical protein